MASKTPDYAAIAFKLLEKTNDAKVQWEDNAPFGDFVTALDEGFSFSIRKDTSRGDTTYSLLMKDKEGNVIFNLRLTDDPETMISRQSLYEALGDLYDIARRRALRVDEKVERVSEILEKI